MGKLRVKYLIIAAVFVAVSVLGGVIAYLQKDAVVFAAFRHGSGTEQDPYRIYNDNQMYNLQEISASSASKERTKGKHFKLMKDVKATYNTGETTYGFYGTLDGNGHTVTLDGYPMFYIVKENATVKNATVKRNADIYEGMPFYLLAYYVNKQAVVENCVFTSEINIFVPTNMSASSVVCATCCVFNNGTIRGCTANVNVSMQYVSNENHGKYGKIYISGMATGGAGEGVIDSCKVNGDMSLITASILNFYVGGIAVHNNMVSDCEYNGNIQIKYRSGKVYPYVYGICMEKVTDCVFNGDIKLDFVPYKYGIGLNGSTYTHNGEIIIPQ